jgi:hypothetical protein
MTEGDGPEPTFEAPHPNGAGTRPARPAHPPWEFVILALFVALIAIAIIVGWVLWGSKSPERFDAAQAARIAGYCNAAQASLERLPNSFPRSPVDQITRIRAENDVLRSMVAQIRAAPVNGKTPAAAVQAWSNDWTKVIDARAAFADALAGTKGTDKKVRFIMPADTSGLKPITSNMDDFVRENHPNLDACFSDALQLETVEGPRTYSKVTS